MASLDSRRFSLCQIGFLVACLGLQPAGAAMGAEPPAEGVVWISRSHSLPALAEEVAKLIVTLDAAKVLPTTEVENPAGATAERLLRDSKAFYGSHFPRQLDRALCKLNSEDCSPAGGGAFQWSQGKKGSLVLPDLEFNVTYDWIPWVKKQGEDLTDTLVQYLGGCAAIDADCEQRLKRMNPAGLEVLRRGFEGKVRLPVLRLTTRVRDTAAVREKLEPNLLPTVEAVVPVVTRQVGEPAPEIRFEGPSATVEPPADAMEEPIRETTATAAEAGRPMFEPAGEDSAEMGSEGVHSEEVELADDSFHLGFEDEAEDEEAVVASADSEAMSAPSAPETTVVDPGDVAFEAPPEAAAEADGAEAAADGAEDGEGDEAAAALLLPPDLSGMAAEERQEKLIAMQQKIFKSIAAPSPVTLRRPSYLRIDPVVSVLDGLVDGAHCGFAPGRLTVFPLDPAAAAATERHPCGDYLQSPDQKRDHATHVTGLIMATDNPLNSSKLRGLDPLASVEAYEVPLNPFDPEAAEAQLQAAAMRSRVVNFSFFYPRFMANDIIEECIRNNADFFLVVAAAGNDGKEYDSSCTRLPACLDLPNVISVAALDLSADEPRPLDSPHFKSDYGPRIHIGAPGLDVPSTIAANRVALYTGTSQAAPLVSAAAALIFARGGFVVEPRAVRDRLIYTSDLLPSLEGKLFGGRLNVERAIDIDKSVITLKPGSVVWAGGVEHPFPAGATLHARIVSFGDPPFGDLTFVVRRVGRDDDEQVNLRRVRRLDWVPETNTYHLFYDRYDQPINDRLDRLKVFLRSPSLPLQLEVDAADGLGVSGNCRVMLGDVIDYVSPLKASS